MLHQNAAQNEVDHAAQLKASLGVKHFFFYTIIYAIFVYLGVANPELMGVDIIGGQNLAIVFGFGLIVLAIIMGFIYNYQCVKLEDKMNIH